MAKDYAAVTTPEEEQRKLPAQFGAMSAYAPADIGAPDIGAVPSSEYAAVGAPFGGVSLGSATPVPSFETAVENTVGAAPKREDFKAPEYHGASKVLHAIGNVYSGVSPLTDPFAYERRRSNAQYESALGDYGKRLGQEMQISTGERLGAAERSRESAERAREGYYNAEAEAKRNPPKNYEHVVIKGPNGEPIAAGFDRATNTYFNPDTHEPIQGAQMWEKPEAQGDDFQRFYQEGIKENRWKGDTKGEVTAREEWAKANRDPNADLNRTNTQDERTYQFFTTQIGNLRKPIADRAERFSRLSDTMDQGTPQSDALVAPELLSLMAGGQGSGLRMNEAEISRIVGGRTKLEDLKAKVQHWTNAPNEGFALTPAQRQQVKALMNAAGTRIQDKLDAIDTATEGMVDVKDPMEYRRIYQKLQKSLTDLDRPKEEGGGNAGGNGAGGTGEKKKGGATPPGWPH